MSSEFRVAVIGATGYAGAELVRLLEAHPSASVTLATSSRKAGSALSQECPWLATDLVLTDFEPDQIDADFTFLCQESGFAMEVADKLIDRTRVIDLSADFRLLDPATYAEFYGRQLKPAREPAAYGLPELADRRAIAGASLVANPGCYPTASLLGLMPLVRAGLIEDGTVPVIDAKSGVSGAGRSRKESEYLFSELDGGFRAYGAVAHRHTPEIEQMAGMKVRFTPHLIPIARGLEATIHVPLKQSVDLRQLYHEAYVDEPFVSVVTALPSTKQVLGSNRCDIMPLFDARTGFAVITSVIDNLGKGAAGQAIQNMNLMAGLPETTGLPIHGIWP